MAKTGTQTKESKRAPRAMDDALFDEKLSNLWIRAFNASPDMISILDKRHRVVAVNTAMSRAMGCSAAEARGKHCYELLHQTIRPPSACPHMAMLEDGGKHQAEIYEERLDQWLLISVTPLLSPRGDLIGSIHIARDITRQKRTEQALRESQERLLHLSEATVEGVFLSEGGTIIAANQVFAQMVGHEADHLPGKQLFDFIAPHHHERLHHFLRNRLSGEHELDFIRKDGTIFPIEAHSKAVSYKNAMVYQTAIRDLSQQKSVEQERAMRERLQGVLEMAGAVCHEINQPMMALYGHMEILGMRAANGDSLTHNIEKMAEQLKRIKIITRKLMRIAHYKTKDYAGGDRIIDIDQSASESLQDED